MTWLEELRQAAEKATPGPWDIGVERQYPLGYRCHPSFNSPSMSYEDASETAIYIASCSPDHILALIQAVERMREALQWIDKPDHYEPDNYTQVACFQHRAYNVLTEVEKLLGPLPAQAPTHEIKR